MGLKATFDPNLRHIILTEAPTNGQVELDAVVDLYSDGKEDWKADATLNKFIFPFRVVGGDELGGGRSIAPQIFIRNDLGWHIHPYDADHELTVVGNLRAQDTDINIFLPVAGRTITVKGEFSADAIQLETGTSGLTPAESTKLDEIHRVYGLEVGQVVTHRKDPAKIEVGSMVLELGEDVDGNVTVTRTA